MARYAVALSKRLSSLFLAAINSTETNQKRGEGCMPAASLLLS